MDFLLKNFIKNGFIFDSKICIQYNKNDIPKKGKATLKAFCKFQKNLHLGFGAHPNKRGMGYPFPLLALGTAFLFCIDFLYLQLIPILKLTLKKLFYFFAFKSILINDKI